MTDLAEALAALLRAGALEGLRVEAVVKPRPPDPSPPTPEAPPPTVTFTVGPVRSKG